MNQNLDLTVWRTPIANCPACRERKAHTADALRLHHPYAGHGFDRGHWSHPALTQESVLRAAAGNGGKR